MLAIGTGKGRSYGIAVGMEMEGAWVETKAGEREEVMSESMIERVARAMFANRDEFDNRNSSEHPAFEHNKDYWENQARAAIEAMREPTPAMKSAMEPWTRVSGHQDGVWKAGIDAALK